MKGMQGIVNFYGKGNWLASLFAPSAGSSCVLALLLL